MKIIFGIWMFIFGSVLGSFLGCMGYRIPNKIKTTYPSSFCPNCKKSLKWYMNIPIISYIVQGGKCTYCKCKIGIIYFICEILCATLFVINYLVFDLSYYLIISDIISCMLITIIVSDFLYYYISDRVIVISGILILITNVLMLNTDLTIEKLISMVVIFLVMIGLKILGNNLFDRESLGDGDIKLMAIIALCLGWLNSFVCLFFSSVIALITIILFNKKFKDGIIPFGPFLLIGCLIVLYFSNIIDPFLASLL